MKHKTSFICYFEFHDLYLFTFSRLKSLQCPSSTHFAGQLANIIGPLKCYNDDYQCYDYQCYPRFTHISAFYSHIRVLPSRPSVRTPVRISVRTSVRPSVHPSVRPSVRPYPRFTLTLFKMPANMKVVLMFYTFAKIIYGALEGTHCSNILLRDSFNFIAR